MFPSLSNTTPGLHYQSFCDHSGNFAWAVLKEMSEGTDLMLNNSLKQFLQTLQNLEHGREQWTFPLINKILI